MRARELAEQFPSVSLDTDALTAARTMGDQRHPGLIVCDERRATAHGAARLAGAAVHDPDLRPGRPRAGPGLRRAGGRQADDQAVAAKTVKDLLPRRQDRDELPVVDPDATTARGRGGDGPDAQPDRRGRGRTASVLGAVTVSRLFEVLFPTEPDCLHDHGPRPGRVRRGLRPDRHRADPPGRRRARRRRRDGRARSGRRRGRVLQRAHRRGLERHLPAARHDGHRRRASRRPASSSTSRSGPPSGPGADRS